MAEQVIILCQSCNRPTREDIVYATIWLGGELNVIEGVPAHVCDDCRVQYYDPDVEEKIRALYNAGFPRHLSVDTFAVPVFRLDGIEVPQPADELHAARG